MFCTQWPQYFTPQPYPLEEGRGGFGFVTISKRGNYVEGRDEEGTLGCVRIFELVIEYPSKERMTIDDEDGDFIMDDV